LSQWELRRKKCNKIFFLRHAHAWNWDRFGCRNPGSRNKIWTFIWWASELMWHLAVIWRVRTKVSGKHTVSVFIVVLVITEKTTIWMFQHVIISFLWHRATRSLNDISANSLCNYFELQLCSSSDSSTVLFAGNLSSIFPHFLSPRFFWILSRDWQWL
jgi:hypothetical protein